MALLEHIVAHSVADTAPLVPFLFVTYLALELLEHMAGDRVNAAVKRAGAAGPVVGALLGIVPQCGFSAMAATLYAGRVITIGTLAAVFLSTSDEMVPLLVAERVDMGTVVLIVLTKALVACVTGLAADTLVRRCAGTRGPTRRSGGPCWAHGGRPPATAASMSSTSSPRRARGPSTSTASASATAAGASPLPHSRATARGIH